MNIVNFRIGNWGDYNPRADRKNFSWFRFENTFFTNPKLFSLNLETKMLLIFMFCEASKKGDGKGCLNVGMVTAMIGLSEKQVMNGIQDIKNTGIIEFDNQETPKDANVCPTNVRDETNERTNETDVRPPQEFEIEKKLIESWNYLDIKQHTLIDSNFKKVQKKLKKRLGENSLDEILQAMKNYSEALTIGWFSYKWSLWDFLSREGANKFYPEEYVKENFMDTNSEQVKFNNMRDRENPYAR